MSGIVGGNVTLVGIGNLVLNGAATAMTVSNYGAASTLASVTLTGDATIAVGTSGTGNTVQYTSLSPTSAMLGLAAGGPTINIASFNNTAGNLQLTSPLGLNALEVIGSSGNDQFNVALGGIGTRFMQTTGGAWVPVDFSGFRSLAVDGEAGDDMLTVDSTTGAVTTPISYDGGTGANALTLTGGTATSDVYTPGPNGGQGVSTLVIGGNTETVQFVNLAPVFDNVAGPLVVNGTNGNDAITAGAIANLVSVNNFETIAFANKSSLTLNGMGGDDAFNVSPANITLTGGSPTITVNGAAGANDTLTVNGTVGNDTLGYNPTTPGAGSVTVNAAPVVNFLAIAQAAIDGQGGADQLTNTTPASMHRVTYTPGAAPDAGTIASRTAGGGTALTPLAFSHIGAGGSVTFASAGGREDVLELYGTNDSDIFNVNGPADTIQILNPTSGSVTTQLHTGGISALEARGLNGDDTFNLIGALPYSRRAHRRRLSFGQRRG